MEGLELRIVTVEDCTAYWHLRLEGLREYPTYFGANYEQERDKSLEEVRKQFFSSPLITILGAWLDGELVAVAGLMRKGNPKFSHKGECWGVYVTKLYQGRGIARKLLQQVIELAKGMDGLEQLQITVGTSNHSARALYQSLGFEAYALQKRALKVNNVYYDEEDMVLYLT